MRPRRPAFTAETDFAELRETDRYLPTSDHPPGLAPHPQAIELRAWLWGLPPFALGAHK